MEGQITLNEWMSIKEDIRKRLMQTTENFIVLGYRMKQIRDSKAYEQDGCSSITEWAKKEYGLDKTSISRFIAINDRFSEDGNSLILREEFLGLGSSKLSEMLSLPETDYALITPQTSVQGIRELKQFNREAPQEENGQQSLTPLQKCIIDLFSDVERREALNSALNLIFDSDSEDTIKKASDIINPTGNGTWKKGIIFLFLYDYRTGIKVKTFGKEETEEYTWRDILNLIFRLFVKPAHEPQKTDFWVEYYGPVPEKKKPVVLKNEPKKEEKKKPVKKPSAFSKQAELRSSQLKEEDEDLEEDNEDEDSLKEEDPEEELEETVEEIIETPPADETDVHQPQEELGKVTIIPKPVIEERPAAVLEDGKDLGDLLDDIEYESQTLWKSIINWKVEKLSMKDLTDADEQLQKIRDLLYELMEEKK